MTNDDFRHCSIGGGRGKNTFSPDVSLEDVTVPVLTCPKCPTKLKVPDGVSGNTRCPKCGTVFPIVKPAFEVVEEAPRPAPAPKPAPKSTSAPAPKPAARQADFEVVDE